MYVDPCSSLLPRTARRQEEQRVAALGLPPEDKTQFAGCGSFCALREVPCYQAHCAVCLTTTVPPPGNTKKAAKEWSRGLTIWAVTGGRGLPRYPPPANTNKAAEERSRGWAIWAVRAGMGFWATNRPLQSTNDRGEPKNASCGRQKKGNSHGNLALKKAIRSIQRQFALQKRQSAATPPYRHYRKKAIRWGALPVFIILKGRIHKRRLRAVWAGGKHKLF